MKVKERNIINIIFVNAEERNRNVLKTIHLCIRVCVYEYVRERIFVNSKYSTIKSILFSHQTILDSYIIRTTKPLHKTI